MINLSLSDIRQQLASTIVEDINDTCVELYENAFRHKLGPSSLGEDCGRKLWYAFRWIGGAPYVKEGDHRGRVLRLFQRGRDQEANVIEWLRKAGYVVKQIDPNTLHQFGFEHASGHISGSIDGLVYLPEKFGFPEPLLLEIKTCKASARFLNYFKIGLKMNEPKYHSQISTYGRMMNIQYTMFIVICKDDDRMYVEIVENDFAMGEFLIERGLEVLFSEVDNPPKQISLSPAKFECKYCDFLNVCHYKDKDEVAVNCRSCIHSQPKANGKWVCTKFNNIIPPDFIPIGCEHHEKIT